MSVVSDLLNARCTKNLTYQEIGKRAEKSGFTLSQASATEIRGGGRCLARDEWFHPIALVLPVRAKDTCVAQDGAPRLGTPSEPPGVANHLTLLQRAELELIKAIVREGGARGAAQEEDQQMSPSRGAKVAPVRPGEAYLDKAARTGHKGGEKIGAAGEEDQDEGK